MTEDALIREHGATAAQPPSDPHTGRSAPQATWMPPDDGRTAGPAIRVRAAIEQAKSFWRAELITTGALVLAPLPLLAVEAALGWLLGIVLLTSLGCGLVMLVLEALLVYRALRVLLLRPAPDRVGPALLIAAALAVVLKKTVARIVAALIGASDGTLPAPVAFAVLVVLTAASVALAIAGERRLRRVLDDAAGVRSGTEGLG